jgi:hypothetical protein
MFNCPEIESMIQIIILNDDHFDNKRTQHSYDNIYQ